MTPEQMIFTIKVNWYIDGSIGTNPSTRVNGSDTIVCICEENDIDLCCEAFIELAGQGKNHTVVIDDCRISDISFFSSAYWNFNNVSYFTYSNFEILKTFSLSQYDINEVPQYISESIQKQYYYWR